MWQVTPLAALLSWIFVFLAKVVDIYRLQQNVVQGDKPRKKKKKKKRGCGR